MWFSHERAVESGAHFATVSLCSMPWRGHESVEVVEGAAEENRCAVPVVEAPAIAGGCAQLLAVAIAWAVLPTRRAKVE